MEQIRIMITGANGLLGQELVHQIVHQNTYKLLATACDTTTRLKESEGFTYTPLDVSNKSAVKDIFNEFDPAYVINCAAMTGVDDSEVNRDQCWCINAEAVKNLAQCCHHHGAHLIHLSSDFVFDGKNGPYRENDRPNPINYYGKSKLAGENDARIAGGANWTIVRTNVLYGNAHGISRPDFVQWVLQNLRNDQEIHVFTDQWRTPSYTYDLAKGILSIVHFQKKGVYNLSGRDYLSMYEFSLLIAEVFGLDSTLIKPADQNSKPQTALRPKYTGLVILKAETELDYRPMPLKSALTHLYHRLNQSSTQTTRLDAWC
ncbi:MAG: dTDP-4-dehydrorhamnose reductase [Bacteroidetes bacterium]|nr:dTDP-4-dehydrorhamnose reductase [Bacteroidota bacterium]